MNYVIMTTTNINQTMVDDCVETSLMTLRNSNDGRSILKYLGAQPASLSNATPVYTQAQMLIEVAKAEWLEV